MRIALGVEYDGTDFLGWQRLGTGRTVQGVLEEALSFVANTPIEVTCAGRTDAGVHGRCQVVHFDTDVQRQDRGWILGTNSRLPTEVAVRWLRHVPDAFHARFSARARRYRYTLLNRPIRPALDARFVAWERLPLDVERMQAGAQHLIGEHDFNAFRTVACQAPNPVRTIHALQIERDDDRIHFEIQANAFLHHMVRNIIGSLLPVGLGERPPEWVGEVLRGRDRALAGPTAPACGLTFLRPLYPDEFGLPAEVCL
ncbi:tRNA pseudouridine(38-40) synthase TruA [Tahibacter amnicola]|uniref:tRNA pseudouridine synthase A n=1 Tax=Tahibacter amnicola TaxID=2976241 RepID=A0ABY6BAY3_9GAMM|nr:tRNA pseudouridine(38-40) synthase TruA [Tahibacter amnicola]UXI66962.1 tRNA pseudouridine(38-40) synthase TruA [Tahibacter amnicola]